MKAIVFDRFGGTEVLHESDLEIPEPGVGQMRVRVKAAGVNALDGKVRSGAMQAAFPTPLPAVPGYELAGVVDAAGEDELAADMPAPRAHIPTTAGGGPMSYAIFQSPALTAAAQQPCCAKSTCILYRSCC